MSSSGPAGAEEISLTAVLDLEGNPEVSVTLCRADGETCIARVDGEQVGSVSRSQAVALMESEKDGVRKFLATLPAPCGVWINASGS